MFAFNRKLIHRRNRDGISIIEVLTSMAVATIGVFGVMVMIPFAVKQSQTGLDNDAANALGRNALEQLQTTGMLIVNPNNDMERMAILAPVNAVANGVSADPTNLTTTIPAHPANRVFEVHSTDHPGEAVDAFGGAARYFRPGVIHFDPIGVAGQLTEVNIPAFPGTPNVPEPGIRLYSATARRTGSVDLNLNGAVDPPPFDLPEGGALTIREASRMCRSNDELFFENTIDGVDETAPPQPLFDLDGANQIKRQFGGRISWSAFLVPEKDPSITGAAVPVNRYRTYAVVYRDRFVDPADPAGSNYEVYLTNMSVGLGADSYVDSVNQITFAAGFGVDTEEVIRGDWVMLLNRIPLPNPRVVPELPFSRPAGAGGRTYRAAAEGYRLQLMFAKVTRVADDGLSVSVDGGAFDFVPPGIGGSSRTYMLHLKNVVNVYERSIAVEKH